MSYPHLCLLGSVASQGIDPLQLTFLNEKKKAKFTSVKIWCSMIRIRGLYAKVSLEPHLSLPLKILQCWWPSKLLISLQHCTELSQVCHPSLRSIMYSQIINFPQTICQTICQQLQNNERGQRGVEGGRGRGATYSTIATQSGSKACLTPVGTCM